MLSRTLMRRRLADVRGSVSHRKCRPGTTPTTRLDTDCPVDYGDGRFKRDSGRDMVDWIEAAMNLM